VREFWLVLLEGLNVLILYALVVVCAAMIPAAAHQSAAAATDVVGTASVLLQLGKADSALALVKRALRSDSTNAELWLALGDLQEARGRTVARIAALRRALELQPRSATALEGLAESYLAAGPPDSARAYAWAALRGGSWRSPNAFYLVGRAFEMQGIADSAIVYYRWAWSLMPRSRLF
jgi:tetratricopeptide (TPR) repeat protein